MSSVVGLVVAIICSVACYKIAQSKGRGTTLWAILGFFFSIISLIIIAVLPKKTA
jgi:hypothetical protein